MSLEQLFREATPQQIVKLVKEHFSDSLSIYYLNVADEYEEEEPIDIVHEQIEKYEYESEILFNDLYLSAKRLDTDDQRKKKDVLMQLMRYIDAQLAYIRHAWPDIPIKEETLAELSSKYEVYDDLYDELLIM